MISGGVEVTWFSLIWFNIRSKIWRRSFTSQKIHITVYLLKINDGISNHFRGYGNYHSDNCLANLNIPWKQKANLTFIWRLKDVQNVFLAAYVWVGLKWAKQLSLRIIFIHLLSFSAKKFIIGEYHIKMFSN